MTLLLASTFYDALAKLSHNERKQAKLTAFDLQIDPAGNGLQMHRIEKSDGFWSARVSGDIRIILHKDGDTTTLAWVDHHDPAYRWAERRKMVPHERTGAMQFVEVVERQVEQLVYAERVTDEAVAEPLPMSHPFAELTDDQMLDVGVPREWMLPVREASEASVDGLFESLPAEAAEALLDFLTGGNLEDHVAVRTEPGTNPFNHPDAQRRFRLVENIEELQAALDQPFEKWAVFLHPAQRDLVQHITTGPTRVTGSAGTGKTIVALHRAVHLTRKEPQAHILLTSFSKPLAQALAKKRDILTEGQTNLRQRISVLTLDQAAMKLFTQIFGQPHRAAPSQIRAFIKEAQSAGLGSAMKDGFMFDEWTEVIDAWNVIDEAAYATVPRIGRKTRLGVNQRGDAWSVFAFVRQRLCERGLVTWSQIYARLSERLANDGSLPFSHVVVDEAQDLSVAQVRFLGEIAAKRADAVFLAGDIGQRIFHLPFSWARLGLDIRGRSHSLKVNYRTSHQIRLAADRLLPPSITDMDGVEEGRRGTVSVFDGPTPAVIIAADEAEERDHVASFLTDCLSNGIAADEIGILVRSDAQLSRARAAAKLAGLDPFAEDNVVVVGMHAAKGLEFRAVVVMACDENILPDLSRLGDISDIADLEAAYETERHLLYVACTRARDHLFVTGIAPGSEFLDDLLS